MRWWARASEEQGAEQVKEAKVKERPTVMNTKVPMYGMWRKNEREGEDVTFMGINIATVLRTGLKRSIKRPA